MATGGSASPGGLAAGAIIAGCRIEHRIGQGGMGSVYLARQLELDRLVALKVVNPGLAGDREFAERFRVETRIAAQVEHPNVVPLYEAGSDDGLLFMLMRYIPGRDLGALLTGEGAPAPPRAVELIAQVAAGLDAVHAAGLVHRDLKPANVLVAGEPGSEHAYLTDFGLAKRAASQSGPTMTGHFVGTLDYIAPEQLTGRPVDARADVYALGCLLFELLTGQVPYPREDTAATMWAHVNTSPPALSTRTGPELERFDELITRALAKHPEDRYPSAGDLGRAALAAVAGQAPAAPERSVATGRAAPATLGGPDPATDGPRPTRNAAPAPTRSAGAPPPTRGAAPDSAPPWRRPRTLELLLAAGLAIIAVGIGLVALIGGGEESGPGPLGSEPYGELGPSAIGPIALGDTMDEVEAEFGAPTDKEDVIQRGGAGLEGTPYAVWTYEIADDDPSEDSLRLYFQTVTNELSGYSSVTDQLETDRGVTTGESLVELESAYEGELARGPGGFQTAATYVYRSDPDRELPAQVFAIQGDDVGAIEAGDPPPNLDPGTLVSRCGDLSFAEATEFGAFRIRAEGTTCGVARDVAADSETAGGGDYETLGFECAAEPRGGPLPSTGYDCFRGIETVRFVFGG